MKNLLLIVSVVMFCLSAFAVPRGLYLASPKAIVVDGPANSVKLYFDLACKNEFPDEWAGNLVAVSDDEGDMSVALGVVLAKSSCDAGPKKQFIFTYPLKATGVTLDDIKHDVTFEPVDLKN
jgi:hypothetical protein